MKHCRQARQAGMKMKMIMGHLPDICLVSLLQLIRNFQPSKASDYIRLTKGNRVGEIIKGMTGPITKSEIMEKCPDISQITIQRALIDLQNDGSIIKIRWRPIHEIYMELG